MFQGFPSGHNSSARSIYMSILNPWFHTSPFNKLELRNEIMWFKFQNLNGSNGKCIIASDAIKYVFKNGKEAKDTN